MSTDTSKPLTHAERKQVCQLHGQADDVVLCRFRLCQSGCVPLWTEYGMPAGTQECTVCHGKGNMPRGVADAIVLPYDAATNPPCICWALR